jgi:hypothetical protein
VSVVASVMCRCFADGRATPPATLASLIMMDQDGFLALSCPRAEHEALHDAFEMWRMEACEHFDMAYVEATVSGYSRACLKGEAAALGAVELPALLALTEADEGVTPPGEAARLLVELRRFRELERFGERTVLFDAETGAELAWCVKPDRKTLAVSDGRIVGLGADGVFVEGGFRARRIRQDISDELALDRRGSKPAVVRLTNLDDDAYVELARGIAAEPIPWPDGHLRTWQGHRRFRYPRELHVEARPQIQSVFESVLGGLEDLCRASVELGNPIRWGER